MIQVKGKAVTHERIRVVGVTGYRDGDATQEFMTQDHFIPILTRFPEMPDDLCKGGRDNDRNNCQQSHQ